MSVEKAFDPTRPPPRPTERDPNRTREVDDIDEIGDIDRSATLAATDLFSDSIDATMPPPLVGEGATPPAVEDEDALAETVRAKLDQADGRVRALVQRHPFTTLAGAAVTGFIIGRILSRA